MKKSLKVTGLVSKGRVRRVTATRNPAGHILAQQNHSGYLSLKLTRNGVSRRFLTHVIEMAAFRGPCPKGYEVNHLDGIKSNNFLPNLEYATKKENQQHALRMGLKKPMPGEENGRAKLTEAQVREILALKGKLYQIDIAKMYGVKNTTISQIHRGNLWKHLHDNKAA